jgi:hypothetical protein
MVPFAALRVTTVERGGGGTGALLLGAVLCTAAATWLSNFASDGPKRRAG